MASHCPLKCGGSALKPQQKESSFIHRQSCTENDARSLLAGLVLGLGLESSGFGLGLALERSISNFFSSQHSSYHSTNQQLNGANCRSIVPLTKRLVSVLVDLDLRIVNSDLFVD